MQGIEDLKYGQVDALLRDGYIHTTKFKTQSKFGFQPVTLSEESKELMQIYIKTFRPKASGPNPSHPNDSLLLNFIGHPYSDIGKDLTSFFMNTLFIHITPTRIRSIVETAAEDMYRAGDISLKTRKSVEAVNGHSSATVKNYYLLNDRTSDVHSARNFFSQAGSNPHLSAQREDDASSPFCLRVNDDPISIDSSPPSAWAVSESAKHASWGTSHPEHHRMGVKKVKWSAQELDYVQNWIENDKQGDSNLAVSRCLAAIRNDRHATHIFHPHHILNSGRLRNGYDSIIKKKKLELDTFILENKRKNDIEYNENI